MSGFFFVFSIGGGEVTVQGHETWMFHWDVASVDTSNNNNKKIVLKAKYAA